MKTERLVQQMPAFKRAYKKLHTQHKKQVCRSIRIILEDLSIGTKKKGDLFGVYVYKFKIHHQEFLLAYEWDDSHLWLLALGVHENFYRDLKRHP